jgi:hypothetical protein
MSTNPSEESTPTTTQNVENSNIIETRPVQNVENNVKSINLEQQTPPINDQDIDKDFSELVRILYKNERYYDENKQSEYKQKYMNLHHSPVSDRADFLKLIEEVLTFNIQKSKTDAEKKIEEKILSENKPIIEKLLIYCVKQLENNPLPDKKTLAQKGWTYVTGSSSYDNIKNIRDKYEYKKAYFRAILTSINKQLPYYNPSIEYKNPNIPYNDNNVDYYGIDVSYNIRMNEKGIRGIKGIIGGKKSRRTIKNKKSKKRKTSKRNTKKNKKELIVVNNVFINFINNNS